jgi:isocitrate lyase
MAPAEQVEQIAIMVAEAQRLRSTPATPHWEDLPQADQDELRAFVSGILSGRPVAQQHEAWFADQVLAGWTYGPTLDAQAKTDPDLVHWEDYTAERRAELLAASRLVLALSGLV